MFVCMVASLFSGTVFAAENAADDVPVSDESVLTTQAAAEGLSNPVEDLMSVLSSDLYVKASGEAGLDSRVIVALDLVGTSGTLYLPGKADPSKLFFSWDDPAVALVKDGQEYASGTAPVAPDGESVSYQVKKGAVFSFVTVKTMKGSSEVEPMFLEIDEGLGTIEAMNSDENHDTSCYGSVIFDDVNKYVSIKGRGNSTWGTWGYAKKPYNITIYEDAGFQDSKKVELVKGVKTKKWSLIANFLDNSLMRNKIAMDLAEELGIGMKTRFADIWMNGKYLGNYLITPKNDYNAPDGGYALENDNYLEEGEEQFAIPGMFEIGKITGDRGYYNRMSVKDIGKDAKKQGVDTAAIEAYFLEAWNALEDFDSENYQNYFDMDSWAKMFLMYEVSKTYDCFSGSLLMHRDGLTPSDKLIAGPAWDYDVSFGRTLHKFFVGIAENVQVNAEGWYNDSIGLMAVDEPVSLFQELGKHASFMRCVARVYNENKQCFEGAAENVDRQREVLRQSAEMDAAKFGIVNVCGEYVVAPDVFSALGTGSYKLNYEFTVNWDNYVNNLKEWCTKRVLWLSDHLAPGVDIVTFHGGTVKTDGSDESGGDNTGMPFVDVKSSDWFCPYVKYVYDNGLFSGTSETTFEPNTAMTRAMFVTVLWAREGKPEGGESTFKDLGSDWYKKSVTWAAENGIIGGYSAEAFGPNDPVTREQMAAIMYQYAKYKGYDTDASGSLDSFSDASDASAYAETALKWAVSHHLIAGTGNGLEPKGKATRAQVAVVLQAFNNNVQ